MLVTPLPGTHRDNLLQTLTALQYKVDNLQGGGDGDAYARLVNYLGWAADAARMLRYQVRDADIDRLVLTRRYDALLAGASSGLAGTHQQKFLNQLISLELAERAADLHLAIEALKDRITSWSRDSVFVMADTSVYMHHTNQLEDWDLPQMCGAARGEPIHLLVPMVIVDELDGAKRNRGGGDRRYRAAHALAVIERVLHSGLAATFKEEDFSALESGGIPRGQVTLEVLLDPPGHSRLPINDDEIIDRAVSVQPLADRSVTFLTCDTNQTFRGRAAKLHVIKLPSKDDQELNDRK